MIPFLSWISGWPVRSGGSPGKMTWSSRCFSFMSVGGDLPRGSWRLDLGFHELQNPEEESGCVVEIETSIGQLGDKISSWDILFYTFFYIIGRKSGFVAVLFRSGNFPFAFCGEKCEESGATPRDANFD